MGAISSEQETKLRQAFGGGSTVNTQSKATNNQKQQTTQNKPANKKPMNNKPGEQRNNKIVQTINQRMDNKETTTTKIVTAKATHTKTVAIKQIQTIKTAIPKTITVLQRIKIGPAKITMAGTTKTVAAKTVTTILVAVKIVITGITLITKTAIVSTKREKGKHQQESAKPAVPARKFRELPDVLEYTEGMNVADIAKKSTANQRKSSKIIYDGCHG